MPIITKWLEILPDGAKNWQGWHYGFKLHASISLDGRLCALALTGANIYDAQMEHLLLNKHTRLAVGDTLYGARVMRERMYRRYGTIIVAPPHPKQKKCIMALWQIDLLNKRSKIESVFDYLKEHLHLVSSFPSIIRRISRTLRARTALVSNWDFGKYSKGGMNIKIHGEKRGVDNNKRVPKSSSSF